MQRRGVRKGFGYRKLSFWEAQHIISFIALHGVGDILYRNQGVL